MKCMKCGGTLHKHYDEDVELELKDNKFKVRLSEFWRCDKCSAQAFGPVALCEIKEAMELLEGTAKEDQDESNT